MRYRRWLYVVAGLFVVVVAVGAWIEQTSGLFLQNRTQVLFGYYLTWLAFIVAVFIAPFALYDYLRWLLRTHRSSRMRLGGLVIPVLGFWLGYAGTGWDGCILEIDGGMDQVGICSGAGPIALGLLFGWSLALGFWLVTRRNAAPDQNVTKSADLVSG